MIGPAEIREMMVEYEAAASTASQSWPRPAPTWPVLSGGCHAAEPVGGAQVGPPASGADQPD